MIVKEPIIYVVSDSVGETAELVTKAAISQFDGSKNTVIKRFPYIEELENIDEVISLAKLTKGLIVYTLVKPEMRAYIKAKAKVEDLHAFDIIGPLMDTYQSSYQKEPLFEPGTVRKLDDDYFKKVEAIEFAVKYDDGRDPRGLLRADIVLVGVSRTSKTPLSQYLALKRYKVANVPLVPEVDPPEELFKVPPEKCFGLKISPDKLNTIRRERLKSLGLNDQASYANIKRIEEELTYFEAITGRIGCHVIDVTNKAVEETANVITNIYQKS
ncbi:pyruvate, water dikinase regulatory protein [Rossellomorea marisflavi]|jgi:[pyruvate, water dikinase]-phosphate phosphotransferase / [pyruvate, water dikinase] kinase|uniref:pyruvate, water dikinase regulatory protein n=1 Tax=Rossellomorea TaxID=2837508 RepID=UPI0012F150EE|nr:pyruvate, water dikinase regulatory protein [Rossellomorea marisflavi]MBV6683851.1 kinase/pyrophosphorylase [Bacillus sp. JRC01]VXB82472.1 bifunctional ADP-dependent kinase-Pi-dependent pyrophosphorylase / positive regulator of gluconeogenesis [Bacillus sp. 349Y]MCM2589011.1 kinase/pyrophosphorylase [Rossellomorea marisflavi]MDR4936252.1 pyruvate, water dikinase regulatory protein [Rossellomorea marisflavi]MDW4527403.1 pyruvate, water dikinase regulatory protein [Rossellomorea marisflavi]